MLNRSSSGSRLGRQALLFPLCLVLYEFSTYIGNDMSSPVCWPLWSSTTRESSGCRPP